MICNNCGRENAEGARYCAFCGAAMTAPAAGTARPCRTSSIPTFLIVLLALAAGTILLAMMGIVAAIVFPAFARAHAKARQTACVSNVKQLAFAARMYTQDHDRYFPLAENWCDALMPYTGDEMLFQCPALPRQRSGYAYNASLSKGLSTRLAEPEATVVLFDATGGWNLSGGLTLLSPRHLGRATLGFADGHVDLSEPPSSGETTEGAGEQAL